MASSDERNGENLDADATGVRGNLEPGTLAGEHVITGVLAEGGGGTVYDACHRTTRRPAAVKVLHHSLTALPKMVERFRREVQVLNLLRHPGIVEVWEVGALPDGRPFFAMERLTGRTVSALLEEAGRLLPDEAIEIFEPVCEALAAAHSAGVIHRDVKPTNIMVLDSGPRRIKLLDFGVAKLSGPMFSASALTSEGVMIGTPTSMAPEQILGREVDERVDIYALGVMLYRMLTGRPPFSAPSSLAQIRQHLEQPAPRPSQRAPAAAPLDAIVLRCLEKDPNQRYRTIAELLTAVRAAVRGPAQEDGLASGTAGIAAAIYVEMRVHVREADEHLADHMGRMLDAAEDALREAGLLVAFITGNEILGVCPLSMEPSAAAQELAEVAGLATSLRAQLDEHERSAPGVHANVTLHVGEVLVRSSPAPEVTGGPLVRVDLWAPTEDVQAVATTPAAMHRLAGRGLPPGTGQLVPLPPRDPDRTLQPRS